MHAEDAQAGTRHLYTRGRFVMIALDADGKPAPRTPLPTASVWILGR
jgi:acyl-CoA hydrolase